MITKNKEEIKNIAGVQDISDSKTQDMMCLVLAPNKEKYLCTRVRGHEGLHAGYGLIVWDDNRETD